MGMNDTDQAALKVHPWSRRIRAGLGDIPEIYVPTYDDDGPYRSG